MALRINTNISALAAHKNMVKNDNSLSASLEKLSSGLRINRAADDASGMAIADSLKAQAMGLGQAIKNANDAISMVQTADGALEESINIVNTVKVKAIQAAQDGQTTQSRVAIQSDINKLLEELDMIARTTSFNGQKMLSGNFTNKKFQVGAYSQETINISIASSESTKIGHVTNSDLIYASAGGTTTLTLTSNITDDSFSLSTITLAYDNTRENSVGAVEDAINKLSDVLGISAKAVVQSTTSAAVAAGATASGFAINGVAIGKIDVVLNDADGALVKAINAKTAEHGMFASVDAEGKMTLTSLDGRAMNVTETSGGVLGIANNLDNIGYIRLTQTGSAQVLMSDAGAAGGLINSGFTMSRLSDVNVLTQDDAQVAIAVADSALKDLDKVRADLGSVQNQLTSTISNVSVTRVNITAAESNIRDVDFAEESSNFSKMMVLVQASSFAMAQANASSQNVLSLLQ